MAHLNKSRIFLGNKYFVTSTSTSVPVPVLKVQVPVQVPVLCMQVQVPIPVPSTISLVTDELNFADMICRNPETSGTKRLSHILLRSSAFRQHSFQPKSSSICCHHSADTNCKLDDPAFSAAGRLV